jgi:uncharacterized membrane protein YjfL (UPF0719 family)
LVNRKGLVAVGTLCLRLIPPSLADTCSFVLAPPLPSDSMCGILPPSTERKDAKEEESMVAELLLSLAQLVVAVFLGAITAYLAFYLFQWFSRGMDEWAELRQANPAVGVVLGSIVVAVAIVLRPALSVNSAAWDVGGDLFVRVLLAEALQLAIGLVLAVGTLTLALYIFAGLTRGIDELEELKKGNLAIAGLLAGVVLGISLLVSQAVGQILALISSVLF